MNSALPRLDDVNNTGAILSQMSPVAGFNSKLMLQTKIRNDQRVGMHNTPGTPSLHLGSEAMDSNQRIHS
jgi:hypothetical protein